MVSCLKFMAHSGRPVMAGFLPVSFVTNIWIFAGIGKGGKQGNSRAALQDGCALPGTNRLMDYRAGEVMASKFVVLFARRFSCLTVKI